MATRSSRPSSAASSWPAPRSSRFAPTASPCASPTPPSSAARSGFSACTSHRTRRAIAPTNVEPDRARKLLLHKKEIRYLIGKTKEKGNTLVPLKMYFAANNLAKVEIGLARGKKLYDKRADIAEKDQKRDVERALRERQKGQ